MNTNLSYDEFLCVTLLYAATVNEDFTEEEKECIIKDVGIDTYRKMYDLFDKMSDFEALQTIMGHKAIHYPTPDRRQEVLDKIESIFNSDGNYDSLEKEIFHFLKNLL